MNSTSLIRKADNARRALAQLEAYCAWPIVNDRDKAGIIQAFEFTFECFWKAFQAAGTERGMDAIGPRPALKAAFQIGLIPADGEEAWLDMLDDRNESTHIYEQTVADAILKRIQETYLPILRRTAESLTAVS